MKRLLRIAPVYLQNITFLCPLSFPSGTKPGTKPLFVPSSEMAESLAFSDAPREPRVGFELVWGFSCQVVVFGLLQFFVRSGKGRSSSRRPRSGSRSARKGSRDRNGSKAWRLAA